jgi:hypothetical protein
MGKRGIWGGKVFQRASEEGYAGSITAGPVIPESPLVGEEEKVGCVADFSAQGRRVRNQLRQVLILALR